MNAVKPISSSSKRVESGTTININIMTPAPSTTTPIIQQPVQSPPPPPAPLPPPPPPPPPPPLAPPPPILPYQNPGFYPNPYLGNNNLYYPNTPFNDNYRFYYMPWGNNYNSCGPIRGDYYGPIGGYGFNGPFGGYGCGPNVNYCGPNVGNYYQPTIPSCPPCPQQSSYPPPLPTRPMINYCPNPNY